MVLYNPCRCLERLPQKSKHEFSQVLILDQPHRPTPEPDDPALPYEMMCSEYI
jgi:hypothetical protein